MAHAVGGGGVRGGEDFILELFIKYFNHKLYIFLKSNKKYNHKKKFCGPLCVWSVCPRFEIGPF